MELCVLFKEYFLNEKAARRQYLIDPVSQGKKNCYTTSKNMFQLQEVFAKDFAISDVADVCIYSIKYNICL